VADERGRVTGLTAAHAEYDCLVVGAGPAGCATALALRARGVGRVLVVDAARKRHVRIGESIPPDTRLLLEELGIWEAFLGEGHRACLGSRSCWGSHAVGYNDYLFNPHGTGWHLDRQRFESFLIRQVELCGARFRAGAVVHAAERLRGGGYRILFSDGSSETARFVVDASGPGARIGRGYGASRLLYDRLTCVAGYFALPADWRLPQTTMLEAVEYGWWYAAEVPGHRAIAMLATDGSFGSPGQLRRPEVWLRLLRETRHLAALLQDVPLCQEPLMAQIAASSLLDQPAGDDWLAVGDAASAFDPLSSQGIYKALLGGIQAAAAICASAAGDSAAMQRYADTVHRAFGDYLRNRNYFYATEQRWSDSPFWKRRREVPAALLRLDSEPLTVLD
jgi:flavin-dependent dehydrogenase